MITVRRAYTPPRWATVPIPDGPPPPCACCGEPGFHKDVDECLAQMRATADLLRLTSVAPKVQHIPEGVSGWD